MTDKLLIWMLHLWAFPWHPWYVSLEKIIADAKLDINALITAWYDAIMIENWNDNSSGPFITQNDYEFFDTILKNIRSYITIKCWINVLPNDYRSAFKLADKYNLNFIQMDVVVDHVITDYSYSTAEQFTYSVDKADFLTYKDTFGKDIIVFWWIHPKHYKIIDGKTFEQSLTEILHWPIEYIVVTGIVTWKQADFEEITFVKEKLHWTNVKLCVGSWINHTNIGEYMKFADAAIVWTSIKDDEFLYIDVEKASSLKKLIK